MQTPWKWMALLAGMGTAAHAQNVPEFDAQNVRPTIDARRTLLTDDAGLAPSNTFLGKLVFSSARDQLTFTLNRNGQERSILKNLMTADLIFAYTVSQFRMGLDVPVVLQATSDIAPNQGGLGDLALDFRGTILVPNEAPVGLALAARFGAPTATVDLPIGGSGLGYEASLIVDKHMGDLFTAINVGYRGRPPAELDNIVLDDQVVTRVGLGYQLSKSIGLSGDVVGYIQPSAPMGNAANGAWEGLLGGWYRANDDFIIRLGGGAGLSSGIGTSKFRMLASAGYEPEPALDSDGDGMLDRVDGCPNNAEDFDGHEDADGCADEENPVRILFRDPYGYPVDDLVVSMENEDDGTRAEGGAQFDQLLTPGVWMVEATAPGFHSFEEDFTIEEGEPFETVYVLDPIVAPPQVRVTRQAIRITDKIYFEVNEGVLSTRSYGLLDAIAQTMASHPEVTRVRVEGHTDSRASDDYNMTLSQQRAEAVRVYLINAGVQPDRLVAVGKGEREPLDARETPDAWDLNRRVEFMIESRN
jgi:outer membrane protein OmpA-like peptidoglycan-associated protein